MGGCVGVCECACERAQTEHKSIGGGKQRFPHTAAHRESVANRGPPSLPRWSSFWSLARVLDLSLCFNRFSCPYLFMVFNGLSRPYCFLSFATRKPLSLPGAKEPSPPNRTGAILRAPKRFTGPEANDRGPVQPRQNPFEIPFEKPYGLNTVLMVSTLKVETHLRVPSRATTHEPSSNLQKVAAVQKVSTISGPIRPREPWLEEPYTPRPPPPPPPPKGFSKQIRDLLFGEKKNVWCEIKRTDTAHKPLRALLMAQARQF